MTTKNTEDSKKPETTEIETNDNKKVFGPLGKYAVVAVIMVSIIVTTAIMLNKQLGSVEEQLAVMENEVAEMNDANTVNAAVNEAVKSEVEEATAETVSEAEETVEVAEADIAPAAKTAEVQAVETPSAETLVATENVTEKAASAAAVSTEQTSPAETVAAEPAIDRNAAIDNQFKLEMAKRDQERQARIEAYKLEQKQHMTEMFARIQTLEAQRLDEYKIKQDEQVERLRQQIAEQEQLIEELILRNKERIEMREASMQHSQSKREEMLNRI